MLQAARNLDLMLADIHEDKNKAYNRWCDERNDRLRAKGGLQGGHDTLDFRGLQQLTLSEAWSQSSTQQMDMSE